MTETQKRIRAYKRALPQMKERVVAVALLLAMSVSMMSSATFAWITLSTSPEASSLATTIVANGNLEIALSNTEGSEPNETAIGDGGREVALSNLAWGNLINLSDDSYGLERIVLRPASLDTRDLINSPMSAVLYGADGRVIDRTTDFAFSNYDKDNEAFVVPTTKNEDGEERNTTRYGVRAVSSVTYKDVSGNTFLIAQMDKINKNYTDARGLFQSIYKSDAYMKTVGYLIGVHVTYVLSEEEDVWVDKSEVSKLKTIADVFYNSMYYAGCAITEMINLHQYLNLDDSNINTFNAYTFEDLFMVNYDGTSKFTSSNINNAVLDKYIEYIQSIDDGLKIDEVKVDTFRQAWINTVNFHNGVNAAYAKSMVYWAEDLMNHVNLLCDMDSATLNGLTASQMADDMINQAISIISKNENDHIAVLHKGALKDADQLLDGDFYVRSGKVSITVVVPESIKEKVKDKLGSFGAAMVPDVLTLKPEIYTTAEPPALLATDYQTANTRASGGSNLKGVAIAADTYAMAVDFWLRTNVPNSLLILEGESEIDPETGAVIGYNGVNRVWDELDDNMTEAGALIYQSGGTSTTQGSGSCYIFYAETPEQQSQSLNMLKAMRVAFVKEVDNKGVLLAVAEMDTDSKVEESGRVIVPLKLRSQDAYELEDGSIIVDENGEPVTRYIQAMPQNEAQRITALIYLDGEILTNSEVLEAGTIKGQLNIQFGTTELQMVPMEDGDLMKEYYTIDFVQKSYDLGAYDPDNNTIELKMTLTGTRPTTVKGNFLSIINETQGARQQEFTMKLDEDGFWTATVPFAGPGTYELRSIQLDGVDVALKPADQANGVSGNIVRVEIDGVAINSLTCANWSSETHSVRTAETYYQQDITLSLASSDMHTVRGVFIGDNGQNVSVNFAYRNGTYHGTATFNAGGTYTMTYLEVDGTIMPLPASMHKTISLQLGLRAYVTIGTPALSSGEVNEDILKNVEYNPATGWSFVYSCEEPLDMSVSVVIIDDQDNRLTGLEGLELWYGVPGSDNTIDTNLKWESNAYVGDFTKFQSSGVYQFRYIVLDSTNYITRAASAPSITSIPPDIMEYVNQNDYAPVTYQWGADRNLHIKLKNGAAANLYVTLTKYGANNEEVVDTAEFSSKNEGEVARNEDKESKITTFTVKAPSDGNWKITGLEVDTVFYKSDEYPDGKFYSGAASYGDDGVTVTGYDRLDLRDLVEADNIGSYFLTEISIEAKNVPSQSYSGEFMTPHEVNNMTIAVNNQGRPLATVLEEVDELFPDENIDPSVTVGMTYDWDEKDIDYTYSNSSLPNSYVYGNDKLDLNLETGVYEMGNMNFNLEGKYYPTFSLSISGEPYTGTYPDSLKQMVTVSWADPEVKITGVSTDTYNGVELPNGELYNDVSNYYEDYYASTYFYASGSFLGQNSWSIPTVQLSLVSGKGNATSARVTASSSSFSTSYSLSASNGWSESKDIGSTSGFGYTRQTAGTVTADKVVLSDGTTDFTLNLPVGKRLTINNAAYPHYVTLSADTTLVDMPDTITCIDYNGNTFTEYTGGVSSVRIFSPDGRAFKVKLPTLTRLVKDRWEDDPNTVTTYDNEAGAAVAGDYVYYHWTTVTGGCNSTTVHHYKQYQRYERTATKTGKRYFYDDTYTMSTWSGGAAGTTVAISATATYTAGSVDVASVLTRTETLSGAIMEYCYKAVSGNGDMSAMNPTGTAFTTESDIVTAWTEET